MCALHSHRVLTVHFDLEISRSMPLLDLLEKYFQMRELDPGILHLLHFIECKGRLAQPQGDLQILEIGVVDLPQFGHRRCVKIQRFPTVDLTDHPLQMTQLIEFAGIAAEPTLRAGLLSIEIFSFTLRTQHETIISYYAHKGKHIKCHCEEGFSPTRQSPH